MSLKYNFEGKVVLITGSSSGIGAETAVQFSKAGAYVVITGLDREGVTDVSKQCLEISPNQSKALEFVADLSHEYECKRLIDLTITTFGKLDILVNGAGIGCNTNLDDPDYQKTTQRLFDTNYNSIVNLTQLSVKYLEKTNGNIINISSVMSKQTGTNGSPYCAFKAALNMFTKCMAVEMGPKGIRVNAILPGFIKTNIAKNSGATQEESDALFNRAAKMTVIARLGVPIDIAAAVLFLASEQASFVTGANLVVDGGHLANNGNM